ncbi:SOS response-associated peptidase family protein [Chenggangzhangella methanolivorans]|uniref:SOS response-associated peptidase n=1 Tax=Chenggangzhangella methanolivorans TaxID=1437009 RepID=A0A9E6RGB6_9HYPH|nr:SOS response-associated peptidase [Chenggangzhangella methanolivorans]
MCGRFALTSPRAAVEALTGAVSAAEFEPRYNISPSQMVKAVAEDGDKRLISDYRFGLSPGFATEGGARRSSSSTPAPRPRRSARPSAPRCMGAAASCPPTPGMSGRRSGASSSPISSAAPTARS